MDHEEIRKHTEEMEWVRGQDAEARWYQVKDANVPYYSLRIYDERIISLSSKLKKISHKDVEGIAKSLVALK